MALRISPLTTALALSLSVASLIAACGGNGGAGGSAGHGGSQGASSSGSGGQSTGGSGLGGGLITTSSGTGGGTMQGFDVQPAPLQTITVTAGQTTPAVTYAATLDGQPIAAGWGLDKGNLGTIPPGPSSAAVFTPSGTAGGFVTITAGLNNMTLQRQVLVKLTATQNGADPTNPAEAAQIPQGVAALTQGGGVGGVGGEGLGDAVVDAATLAALGSPSSDGQTEGLSFLYPYDKTVWPRGLPAPLLMWTWINGDADAIQISLATQSGSFSYTGTFAKPPILSQTGGKFIRHPIPQDVWDMATNSAGGSADKVTVSLTVAKGGVAYGPISEAWTIAPSRLTGTIYYNSYGTQLAQNYPGAVGGNHLFGGAVLSIRVGDTGPKLVAGQNGVSNANCRVCHSVAALGARLVVQHGENYGVSSNYDIGTMSTTEHVMSHNATYPAIYPDGSMALTEGGLLLPMPTDTTPIPTTGLTSVVTDLGQPAFSPDGKMVLWNPLAGPAPLKLAQTLYVQPFDKATNAFGAATLVADDTGQAGTVRPSWGAFFPDSKSVVYHHQTVASSCDGAGSTVTRSGARAQIYWTDLAGPGSVTPLDQLNGTGYLPKLAQASGVACNDACGKPTSPAIGTLNADHADDVNTNYEPTVAPIASGGYAWVVFTSRRMYGSVATIGSFCSDPRGVDLITNITPKKLWVAAVDLSQGPGVDASHPAFYLPAQEILAGNARAFWVLDPCQPDGTSCMTGDQCCNGYCEPNNGMLVCSNMPPVGMCSGLQEKCTTSADCCDTTNLCINGFCSLKNPG